MKNQNRVKFSVMVALLTVGAGGCTQERPYDALLKDQVLSKNLIDQQAEYLYVSSTGESSRTSTAARPHFVAQEKIVKFRFKEGSLDMVELESEGRFSGNRTNEKLVLSIPVEHLDYKCSENEVGECANKEEQDSKKTWSQKRQFKADFESLKVAEVPLLPVELQNLFDGNCYSEVDAKLLDAKLEPEAVNIRVERFFKAGANCLSSDLESLSDIGFSVIYHYSAAKLDSLATPGYSVVNYPLEDENTFGYFTSEIKTLSEDNHDRVDDVRVLMNRWNPARTEVVYHLSEGFAKPENAAVKRSTYEGVAAINDGLRKAGAKLRIRLEEPSGKLSGDIRNSMIVMVEDPPALGLLGYGPSIPNPRTGEILSARTIMYLGIVKKQIRSAYEDFRKEIEKQKLSATELPGGADPFAVMEALARETSRSGAVVEAGGRINDGISSRVRASRPAAGATIPVSAPARERGGARVRLPNDLREVKALVSDYTRYTEKDSSLQSRLKHSHDHCFYSADDFNFPEAIVRGIRGKLGTEDLKPWEELSQAERNRIMDILVPFVWKPILIHELGHNLGLRHNFQGSEDKDNFYTKEELAKMGVDFEIPSSTVMEYASKPLTELPTLGKYDIAALRFGYARQVELTDGKIIPVDGTLKETKNRIFKADAPIELKPFGFCTDGHVGVNAGCKRFDEGSTYKEIAEYLVRSYEERYKWLNFRNGARNFSTRKDRSYASRIDQMFYNFRVFLEVKERLESRFVITREQWESIEFLKDLDEAVQISAKFLAKVIATPDVHCAASLPNGRIAIVPLSDISSDAISCYDGDHVDRLKARGIHLIAQAGKSFLSKKQRDNPNPYVDQIDVRGVWIDKVIAARYLFDRKLGVTSLDEVAGNFMDYKETATQVKTLLKGLVNGELQEDVVFTLVNGQEVSVPLSYEMSLAEGQLIHLEDAGLARGLGLSTVSSSADTLLSKELIHILGSQAAHVADAQGASVRLLNAFRVSSYRSANNEGVASINVGNDTFVAYSSNEVAIEAIAALKEEQAMLERVLPVLRAVESSRLELILDELENPEAQPPLELSVPERQAKALGPVLIGAYLDESLWLEESRLITILDVILFRR